MPWSFEASQTLTGAGGDASGVFMRLVSLWWELPPRLNSNIKIWDLEMQVLFLGVLINFSQP